jgi:hypothetical protein
VSMENERAERLRDRQRTARGKENFLFESPVTH